MKNIKLKKVPIKILFDFPKTNSKITKKFCNSHKGNIPVYASSKDENSTLGFIQDNLKGVKYYESGLSWNRNGSVGYVFIRNNRFATNEDHRALIIKDQYKADLNKDYLKFEIERQLFLNGFSYLNKCGVDKIKEVNIFIPVKDDGEFDSEKQIELANKYTKIKELKKELDTFFQNIINLKVNFDNEYKTNSIPITELFDLKKGNPKYTKKFVNTHKGVYPVYSANTKNNGLLGYINSSDYDIECIQITTNGVYAGTVFYRKKHKFSINGDAKLLIRNSEYLDYEYFVYELSRVFAEVGFNWQNKISDKKLDELSLSIPVKENGDFDLNKQKKIAEKYNGIETIKNQIQVDYQEISMAQIQIVET